MEAVDEGASQTGGRDDDGWNDLDNDDREESLHDSDDDEEEERLEIAHDFEAEKQQRDLNDLAMKFDFFFAPHPTRDRAREWVYGAKTASPRQKATRIPGAPLS